MREMDEDVGDETVDVGEGGGTCFLSSVTMRRLGEGEGYGGAAETTDPSSEFGGVRMGGGPSLPCSMLLQCGRSTRAKKERRAQETANVASPRRDGCRSEGRRPEGEDDVG